MDDTYSGAAGAGMAIGALVFLAFYVAIILFYCYCLGRIFQKAGRPLWTGFVPVYNAYIWTEIVGRPAWWVVLVLIPFVNVIALVFLAIDLAKSFGKDTVYGVLLLWLFSFIGLPMLAFGNDQYVGPSVTQPNSLVQQ